MNPQLLATAPSDRKKRTAVLLVIALVLNAANLRAAITAVGPLIGTVRDDTGISNTAAGMMTTLTLLAFALCSPLAPRLARKIGMEGALFASLIVLTAGIFIRSMPPIGMLFIGTAFVGMGIAVGNVLLPGLIKRDFPGTIGLMTGIYSVSMNLCAAVASGISIPLSRAAGVGWRGSLACWALLSFAALLVWLPKLRSSRSSSPNTAVKTRRTSLWRSGLAWQVTLFMGLQSFLFYINISWLPEILHQRGLTYSSAGWLLSLMQFVSLPATFLMPLIAGRRPSQRGLAVLTGGIMLAGYAGLLAGSRTLLPLWIVLIGIAVGACFSLSVLFFSLRTRSGGEASELSGMAQSVGYLIAAAGPICFGFVHDMTGTWTAPLIMLTAVAALVGTFGAAAGGDRYIAAASDNDLSVQGSTVNF